MKRALPCILCLFLIFEVFGTLCSANDGVHAIRVQKQYIVQSAPNDGIQVIAKRPFIKRGELGVLALKCTPNTNCIIICNYKINGKDYNVTKNLTAGKDGSVLCTWKVDKNTDLGTYDIVITCGQSKFVTNYIVQ